MTWAKLWDAIRRGAQWLAERPAVIAGLIGTVVGAFVVLRSRQNQIGRLKDAYEAQKLKTQVAKDEAKAEMLVERADEHGAAVEELHKQIATSKRRAAELAHARSLEDATDDEIAKLFSDSGL